MTPWASRQKTAYKDTWLNSRSSSAIGDTNSGRGGAASLGLLAPVHFVVIGHGRVHEVYLQRLAKMRYDDSTGVNVA
jgi:hypothetical protein